MALTGGPFREGELRAKLLRPHRLLLLRFLALLLPLFLTLFLLYLRFPKEETARFFFLLLLFLLPLDLREAMSLLLHFFNETINVIIRYITSVPPIIYQIIRPGIKFVPL